MQLSPDQTEKAFLQACREGCLDTVKQLLAPPLNKAMLHFNDDRGFRWACEKGHVAIVSYLLTSSQLSEHANIHAKDDYGLRAAAHAGHLSVVEFLLTAPEIAQVGGQYANIHANDDDALRGACENGHLPLVEFLLSPHDLKKEHANIHALMDEALVKACKNGHVDIVRHLLTSPNLVEHGDIHADNDHGFIYAHMYKQMEVIKYLVFDYHITLTSPIKRNISGNSCLMEWFKLRDEKKKLEESLPIDPLANRPIKTKL